MIFSSRFLVALVFLALLGGDAAGRATRAARPAPELSGGTKWFNVPAGRGPSIAALRNKVILIEFWTGG